MAERRGVAPALGDSSAADSRADEAASLKTLEDAKATLIRDEQKEGKPVIGVVMWGSGFKVELLKELKEIKGLERLAIGGPWITADGIKELHDVKTLQLLEVRGPNVSDAAPRTFRRPFQNSSTAGHRRARRRSRRLKTRSDCLNHPTPAAAGLGGVVAIHLHMP